MKLPALLAAILAVLCLAPTASSQLLVRDINTLGRSDYAGGYDFTPYNGILIFRATDSLGTELWRTDGTPSGTSMIKDIRPGADSSIPGDFYEYSGFLYFAADDGVNGRELWRTDGTMGGTIMVDDIDPAGASSPNTFFEYNGFLYMDADGGASIGRELHRTDNTLNSVQLFWDVNTGSPNGTPRNFFVFNSKLAFTATSPAEGNELFYTDGALQRDTLVDLRPGPNGSFPSYIVPFNGSFFFAADDDGGGPTLFKSDGTSAGTSEFSATRFNCFRVFNNELYCGKFLNPQGLYKSDGVAALSLVRETGGNDVDDIHEAGGYMYVVSDSIYYTDGSAVGACCTGLGLDFTITSSTFIGYDGALYLSAFWFSGGIQGQELSRYMAGDTQPVPVLDLVPGDFNQPSGASQDIYEGLGWLIFGAQVAPYDNEPWRYTPPVAMASETVSSDGATAFAGTAVSLNFDSSSGSSIVTVEEYDGGVGDMTGIAEGNTLETRWFIREEGDLTFGTSTELRIDWDAINGQGIADPSTIVAYKRDNPGSGTFSSLTTTYEAGPGEIVVTGFDSFSEFALATNSTLPVELSDFSVIEDDGGVLLRWSTASETSNSGFEVQHMARPANALAAPTVWRAIDFVEGAGTTTEQRSYAYRVRDLDSGVHQFRLRQVDFDGAFEYSPVVEVAIGLEDGFQLSAAYPNPAAGATRISLLAPTDDQVVVTLFDALGRSVRTLFEGRVEGGQVRDIEVPLSGLSSGLYFYTAEGRYASTARRLVVTH